MLFEFMTSDMRKPMPETSDEAMHEAYRLAFNAWEPYKKNYILHITEEARESYAAKNNISTPEFLKNGPYAGNTAMRDISFSMKYFYESTALTFLGKYDQALRNSSLAKPTKMAFLVDSDEHQEMNSLFGTTLNTMKYSGTRVPVFVMVGRNSIFKEHFREVIKSLIPTGILDHIVNYENWRLSRPVDVEIEDPRKVLTLEILDFGFYIWLGTCCVSILAFFGELVWWTVTRRLKKKLGATVGLVGLLGVLNERMRVYR
jgi:hypothetical protein